MKILVAMDSFKGSLTSLQAGEAVKQAALRVDPAAFVAVLPLADGGEGTVRAFAEHGELISVTVCGPRQTPVTAQYCILPDSNTAVVEMAAAAGITLLKEGERNPLETTTYGVGEVIRDAMSRGCRRFVVGIGGSATNDGGTGMLTALGYEFLDGNGDPIPLGAKGLAHLRQIRREHALPELTECRFLVACDVTNPLCGDLGCSAVYGPQKGATAEMIAHMDGWLQDYAVLAGGDAKAPGAGAAGGMGFAFSAFLNGELKSGIDIVLQETDLESYIKNADIVVTGEGRLDGQTAMGKAPIGVARLAKQHSKRVIAFSGCVGAGAQACNKEGIDAYFPILREITTLEAALDVKTAASNLTATAEQVFRLMLG